MTADERAKAEQRYELSFLIGPCTETEADWLFDVLNEAADGKFGAVGLLAEYVEPDGKVAALDAQLTEAERLYELRGAVVEGLQERLAAAEKERDEAIDSRATLRSAWNHHADNCEQFKTPVNLPTPTLDDIREWMTAPSATASALGPEHTVSYWRQRAVAAEKENQRLREVMDAILLDGDSQGPLTSIEIRAKVHAALSQDTSC